MDEEVVKKISYSYTDYLQERKYRTLPLYLAVILSPILVYLLLFEFHIFLVGTSILIVVTGAEVLATYYSKYFHLSEISYDNDKNVFIGKIKNDKEIWISLNCIDRIKDIERTKKWNYAYLHEGKGGDTYRTTLIPYEVDEWIQKIKVKHQKKPNHKWLYKRSEKSEVGEEREYHKEIKRIKDRKRIINYFLIAVAPLTLLPAILMGFYVVSTLFLANLFVGALSFNQFASRLLELYDTKSYSLDKYSKAMFKLIIKALVAITVSIIILIWHFGVIGSIF